MFSLRSIFNLFNRRDKKYQSDLSTPELYGEVIVSTSNLPWINIIKNKYNNDISMTMITYKMTFTVSDENREYINGMINILSLYNIYHLAINHKKDIYTKDIFFSGNEDQYRNLISDYKNQSAIQNNIYIIKLMKDINNHLSSSTAKLINDHNMILKSPDKYILYKENGFTPPNIEIFGYSKIDQIDLENIRYGKNILTINFLWMCVHIDLMNAFSSINKDLLILEGGQWVLLKIRVSELIWYLNNNYHIEKNITEIINVKNIIKKIIYQNQNYFSSLLYFLEFDRLEKNNYIDIDEEIPSDKIPKSIEIKKDEDEYVRDSEFFPEHFFDEDESLNDMSVDDMVELLKK